MEQRPPPHRGPRPPRDPPWATLPADLTRADVAGLCARLVTLLADYADTRTVVYDARDVARPDVVTVEALARLQLTARRAGHRIQVHGAGEALRSLLVLTGLHGVLAVDEELPFVEPSRQPEQREQAVGIQKGVEPGDLSVRDLKDN